MTTAQIHEPKPLRLWPGVLAVALLWLIRFVLPLITPMSTGTAILGGVAGGLVVLAWWLFFSRAPWIDRLGAVVLMIVAVFATAYIVHESISNAMMGFMLPIFSIPLLSLALVASAAAGRRLSSGARRAAMAAAILVAPLPLAIVRTAGVTGDSSSELHWRWTLTPEERLLARAHDDPIPRAPAAAPVPTEEKAVEPTAETRPGTEAVNPASAPRAAPAEAEADARSSATSPGSVSPRAAADPDTATAAWPGFRGVKRDAVVSGIRIGTDWSARPPEELWRRPVGPGWSSFAVRGDLVYTQEQRGDDEVVSAYRLGTGEPVWRHRDPVRFWESNGGAGPRATPTVHGDRLYTFGATGIVNALWARSGALIWSRDAARDTGVDVPDWGFASSPLPVGDMVVIAVQGRLVAYDAATGEPRWFGPEGGAGYSSPHLATIGGVPQILLLRGSRTISVAAADGALLWEHTWKPGVGIVQPAFVDGDVLLTVGDGMGGAGIRRVAVTGGPGAWRVEERWTSRGLKPYFNDFVVHEGHAYGFDGSILSCINLVDGERRWKGGRFGHGQLLLLAEQNLLLVLSEDGELALVAAAPDRFTEVARVPALEGKTWNHPVLIDDLLLVRNGEEMAAFRLPREGR